MVRLLKIRASPGCMAQVTALDSSRPVMSASRKLPSRASVAWGRSPSLWVPGNDLQAAIAGVHGDERQPGGEDDGAIGLGAKIALILCQGTTVSCCPAALGAAIEDGVADGVAADELPDDLREGGCTMQIEYGAACEFLAPGPAELACKRTGRLESRRLNGAPGFVSVIAPSDSSLVRMSSTTSSTPSGPAARVSRGIKFRRSRYPSCSHCRRSAAVNVRSAVPMMMILPRKGRSVGSSCVDRVKRGRVLGLRAGAGVRAADGGVRLVRLEAANTTRIAAFSQTGQTLVWPRLLGLALQAIWPPPFAALRATKRTPRFPWKQGNGALPCLMSVERRFAFVCGCHPPNGPGGWLVFPLASSVPRQYIRARLTS